MTTVWRPRVRIPVPEVDDEVEVGVEVPEVVLLTVKGVKRKRAPHTKGPCEHGVKYRSRCKVCSACPHGRQRYQCKECGGASICEHGRVRSHARSAVGCNLRARSSALYARVRGAYCEHGRERRRCKECGGSEYASTVVSALSARSAVGHQSASTVVCALSARSAVGDQSASTVVSAIHARSAAGHNLRARSSALSDARSVAPQRLERMHSSARTPNVVQHIFLQLPIYRTDPRAVVSPPPPDPSSAAAWP